jgi:hypothetical protein
LAEAGVLLPSSAPPRDAILTTEQVAEWLQVSPEQVRRMNLPAIAVGKRKWRYVAGQVLDALAKRAE